MASNLSSSCLSRSSSSPSELPPQSLSTPEIVDGDQDFDEFAIFPRRRTHNESEEFECLGATSEPQDIQIPRPLSVPFNLDRSATQEEAQASTSWNQERRVYRIKSPRAVVSHCEFAAAPCFSALVFSYYLQWYL